MRFSLLQVVGGNLFGGGAIVLHPLGGFYTLMRELRLLGGCGAPIDNFCRTALLSGNAPTGVHSGRSTGNLRIVSDRGCARSGVGTDNGCAA